MVGAAVTDCYRSMTMNWTSGAVGRLRTWTTGLTHVAAARPWPRTVPASVLPGTELIHLGGGESLPCPDADRLPLDPAMRRLGLGTSSLALPPARVHLLRDVVVRPGSRVVATPDGRIVAESVTQDMVGTAPLDPAEMRPPEVEIDGTVAVFRSPWDSRYHTLIDHLPRAALLIHPALHRVGPMTVVHDGPLTPLEDWLLPQMSGRNVHLRQVEPGTAIRADRVVLPAYVTRPCAGAVPSWYRRWAGKVVDDGVGDGPRRMFADPRGADGRGLVANRDELDPVLERHGIVAVDPDEVPVGTLLSLYREADLVVGVHGSGLSHALFSRRAHVVELLRSATVVPRLYYLAASTGLPYDYVPTRDAVPADGADDGDTVVVDVEWLDALLTRIS